MDRASLDDPVVADLINALNADLTAHGTEPGSYFFSLEPAEVAEGRGTFLVARLDGEAVGCAALRVLEGGEWAERTAEVKRMYVDPAGRRRRVGSALLALLIDEARRLGVRRWCWRRETGRSAAVAMYRRTGFEPCACWGEYAGPLSAACLTRTVDPAADREPSGSAAAYRTLGTHEKGEHPCPDPCATPPSPRSRPRLAWLAACGSSGTRAAALGHRLRRPRLRRGRRHGPRARPRRPRRRRARRRPRPPEARTGGRGAGAVTIKDFAFDPGDLTVAKGTTVTWKNDDSATHRIKSGDGSFDSEDLKNGDSFEHTFDTAGTFDYICGIHPSMKGKITVTG